jgi:hypothetical protein
MYRILRTTAVVTMIAVVFQCFLPALAATGPTLEGIVQIPCDPSRVSEVASVRMQPVSGETAATVAVDPSTGAFLSPELTEGEYELTAIGADGNPLAFEPTKVLLASGANKVVLSLEPPGCGENPDAKNGLKDWHLTLIYVGVVAAIILALDDDESPGSPVQP